MLGVIGFSLTFYHCIKINNVNDSKNSRASTIIVLAIAVILVLNITTLKYEMEKSVYRKENYVKMKEAALSLDSYTDEELTKIFEYRKGGKYIRDAFDILKENNLNIFIKKSNLIVN